MKRSVSYFLIVLLITLFSIFLPFLVLGGEEKIPDEPPAAPSESPKNAELPKITEQIDKNSLEFCLNMFHHALRLFYRDCLAFKEGDETRKKIAEHILKEIGKRNELNSIYNNFNYDEKTLHKKLDGFDLRLDNYLRNYLATKENKLLFTQRLVKRILLYTDEKYATFYSEEQLRELILKTNFEDDGLIIVPQDERMVVITTRDGSSAEKAGFLPLDVIIKINNEELAQNKQETSDEFEDRAFSLMIKNKDNLKYTIQRENKTLELSTRFETPIETSEIKKNNKELVLSANKNNIGIIKITSFSSYQVGSKFYAAYKDTVIDKNAKGLIVDLRNNMGGFVSQAQYVASFFIEPFPSPVFILEKKDERIILKTQKIDLPVFRGPLIVLTNAQTASAAEMLAAILRQKEAILIGSETWGKRVAQTIRILKDGSVVHFSIYTWITADQFDFSPNPNEYAKGLIPDIQINLPEKEFLSSRKDKDGKEAKKKDLIFTIEGVEKLLNKMIQEQLKDKTKEGMEKLPESP